MRFPTSFLSRNQSFRSDLTGYLLNSGICEFGLVRSKTGAELLWVGHPGVLAKPVRDGWISRHAYNGASGTGQGCCLLEQISCDDFVDKAPRHPNQFHVTRTERFAHAICGFGESHALQKWCVHSSRRVARWGMWTGFMCGEKGYTCFAYRSSMRPRLEMIEGAVVGSVEIATTLGRAAESLAVSCKIAKHLRAAKRSFRVMIKLMTCPVVLLFHIKPMIKRDGFRYCTKSVVEYSD